MPVTIPVPGEPPPVGDAVALVVAGLPLIVKPSASNAPVLELVTESEFPEVPVFSVIAPPLLTDDASEPLAPVIKSILDNIVETLSPTLSSLPVAPDATKVITVGVATPAGLVVVTVMVSPATKGVDSEVALVPPSNVVPLIAPPPSAVAVPPVTVPLT